jgi:hypothetical protein
MPRGNDAVAVRQEHLQQYGRDHLNVEELIRANSATVSPALAKASKVEVDELATDAVRDDFKKYAARFELEPGAEVKDMVVRGNTIIAVIEGADGRDYKDMVGYTDDWTPPKLTAEEQSRYDQALAAKAASDQLADIRADADARVAEARAEADREVAEALAKIEAEKAEKIDAAQQTEAVEAEPAPPEVAPPPAPDPTRPPVTAGADADRERLEEMTGKELDAYAKKAKIANYDPRAKVAERRKAIAAALRK